MSAEGYPEMIPLKEAARRTGLAYGCLRGMCIRGEIVHLRAGNKYLINAGKLAEYLNSVGREDPAS